MDGSRASVHIEWRKERDFANRNQGTARYALHLPDDEASERGFVPGTVRWAATVVVDDAVLREDSSAECEGFMTNRVRLRAETEAARCE